MAKFCQNCKKTYTDPAATFCEECGGDLVPLEGSPAMVSGTAIPEDDFQDEPSTPLWKKYLPYGAGLAALAVLWAVVPSLITDDVAGNLRISLASSDRVTADLKSSEVKVPIQVQNNSMFSITLESVKLQGTLHGAATCSVAQTIDQEIAKGDNTVDIPICLSREVVKANFESSDGDAVSSLTGKATFRVFGFSVSHDLGPIAPDDEVIKAALKIPKKADQVDADADDHKVKRRPAAAAPAGKKADCEFTDKNGNCRDSGSKVQSLPDDVGASPKWKKFGIDGQKVGDYIKGITEKTKSDK